MLHLEVQSALDLGAGYTCPSGKVLFHKHNRRTLDGHGTVQNWPSGVRKIRKTLEKAEDGLILFSAGLNYHQQGTVAAEQ
jgi:hypothetical protein